MCDLMHSGTMVRNAFVFVYVSIALLKLCVKSTWN